MLPQFFNAKGAARLAAGASRIGGQEEAIYHGTWYSRLILADGVIRLSMSGDRAVSFTRSPRVAAYWAILPRDTGIEDVPAILVFDRAALNNRYRLEPHHYYDATSPFGCFPPVGYYDEMEERVLDRDITNAHRYLRGVAVLDPSAIQLAAIGRVAKGIAVVPVRSRNNRGPAQRQPTGRQLELDLF